MNGPAHAVRNDDAIRGIAAVEPSAPRRAVWAGALALALALASIAWFFSLLVRDVEAADFAQVDTAQVRLDSGPGWVDPRWEGIAAARIAGLPMLRADDPGAIAAVEAELLALPFVAAVESARVLWPDGIEVSLVLREPVACVRAGEQYLTVASDGRVLSGAWSMPPARDHGYLPVIALDAAGHKEVSEGALLSSEAALDGLAVANALWSELPPEDFAQLGRAVIDARTARRATVEEPGTVLWLENGRRVLFGRSPNLGEPGELPVCTKLESLSKALRQLTAREEPLDWEMVDVRWDRPECLPRGGWPAGETKRGR
jgi:hypothetical protein